MDRSVIKCRDLYKSFGDKNVLNGLNLDIPKASVFGLLGKNGSGKTTLIKTLMGLLRHGQGSVTVLGEDPRSFSEAIKERFGYVPQRERLYPWLTAGDLIEYVASFYARWNRDLVARLAEAWRIDLAEQIGKMSEGEAQKVAIILALGHEPELLVLDEPVASLDPMARRQFLKMVLELVADRNCTIFFSTHITSDLERVADRVALLKDGSVSFSGEIEDLRESVKRIRILGVQADPKALFPRGLIRHELFENGIIATIRDFEMTMPDDLKKRTGGTVVVEDLNLEEIFMELS